MADNTKTQQMWQEAASATKDCLPLEVLERMTESTFRRSQGRGPSGRVPALPD